MVADPGAESWRRFVILLKIVLNMWSFNLVLTVVEPVPPNPQTGFGAIGLKSLGVIGGADEVR